VWKRQATESLIKKTIALGTNNVLPNFVAGGMDAVEGTFVWNYTVRSCLEGWKNCTTEGWESSGQRMGVQKADRLYSTALAAAKGLG
jgi:hypothetical protein